MADVSQKPIYDFGNVLPGPNGRLDPYSVGIDYGAFYRTVATGNQPAMPAPSGNAALLLLGAAILIVLIARR